MAFHLPSTLTPGSPRHTRANRSPPSLTDARDEIVVGGIAQRAELLHPADLVAAGHGLENRLEHELVTEARLGLAGDGGDELALADHLPEVAAPLLLAAEGGDEREHGGVHVEGESGGRAALGHLEQAERVGERIGAAPAVGRGNGQPEKAGGAEVGVVLDGKRGLRIVARRPRGEALAGQCTDLLDEGLRLGAERRKEQHPALPRPLHGQLSSVMGKVMAAASARIVDNRQPPGLSRQRLSIMGTPPGRDSAHARVAESLALLGEPLE